MKIVFLDFIIALSDLVFLTAILADEMLSPWLKGQQATAFASLSESELIIYALPL